MPHPPGWSGAFEPFWFKSLILPKILPHNNNKKDKKTPPQSTERPGMRGCTAEESWQSKNKCGQSTGLTEVIIIPDICRWYSGKCPWIEAKDKLWFQNGAIWYQAQSHLGSFPAKTLSFTVPQPPWCWRIGGWETLRLKSFILVHRAKSRQRGLHRSKTTGRQSTGEKLTADILGPCKVLKAPHCQWLAALFCT